jgi:hypothetical protein
MECITIKLVPQEENTFSPLPAESKNKALTISLLRARNFFFYISPRMACLAAE